MSPCETLCPLPSSLSKHFIPCLLGPKCPLHAELVLTSHWGLANSERSANVSSSDPYVYMANCKFWALWKPRQSFKFSTTRSLLMRQCEELGGGCPGLNPDDAS